MKTISEVAKARDALRKCHQIGSEEWWKLLDTLRTLESQQP